MTQLSSHASNSQNSHLAVAIIISQVASRINTSIVNGKQTMSATKYHLFQHVDYRLFLSWLASHRAIAFTTIINVFNGI